MAPPKQYEVHLRKPHPMQQRFIESTAKRKVTCLDLFCGAGGASMGYHHAGFQITGVDNKPQPNYPFQFAQADALDYVLRHGRKYDLIHASPPCQAYSTLAANERRKKTYPDLLDKIRDALRAVGVPHVIENVVGAPLIDPVTLCGEMFGLRVIRHRLFESSEFLMAPPHPKHNPLGTRSGNKGDGRKIDRRYTGYYFGVYGGGGGRGRLSEWREAMGIDWMTANELTQAIPPAYTHFIADQLLSGIQEVA